MSRRRLVFKWIKIVLMIYGLLGIVVYYLQDYIFFHPERKTFHQPYNLAIPFREVNIPYDTGSNINIVQFSCDTPARGVVLYFHGNRKNIAWYASYAPNFTKHHYEVWMIDYPGYGKSTGPLTEQRLYDYAEQLYKLAAARFPKNQIILYGKSMGTGLATWLAARKNCRELILETPYYSMVSLASHYLPIYPVERMIHYKIPSYKYLQEVIVPVTIFHGTDDGVIPYSQAKRLEVLLRPPGKLVTIEGGSHNDLNNYPLFHQQLDSLLQ